MVNPSISVPSGMCVREKRRLTRRHRIPVGSGGSRAFPAVITLSALRKLRDERTSNRTEHAKMLVYVFPTLPSIFAAELTRVGLSFSRTCLHHEFSRGKTEDADTGTMYLINASSEVTEVTDRSLSGKEISRDE